MMPLGAPSISKYGSLVRPDAQIVALRLRSPLKTTIELSFGSLTHAKNDYQKFHDYLTHFLKLRKMQPTHLLRISSDNNNMNPKKPAHWEENMEIPEPIPLELNRQQKAQK